MTPEQRRVAVLVGVGAALSYLTHPLVWLVGPLRWVAFVVATSAQESDFGRFGGADEANGTTSHGPLMYNDTRLDEIGGIEVARDPFRAGYATGGYATRRILDNPAWLVLLSVPFLGWAWFRRLWTGPSSADSWLSPATHADVVADALSPLSAPGLRWVVRLRAATFAACAVVGGLVWWGRK